MTPDRPLLGILLMLGFCILAPLGDALAKVIGQTVPMGILLLVRFGMQALLLWPVILLGRRSWQMSKRVMRLAWLRTALHMIGIGAMFTALQYLPLADAVAIAFVMPFLMLILGHYVLDEEIGARRIIACGVGFIGTLLVIQPAFETVGWPALLPLVVAIVFSLFMLVTRQIAKEIDPISLQAVNGVMAVVIVLPALLLLGGSNIAAFEIIMPDLRETVMLVGIGALGTFAHLLMTWSLRFAPSATVAPMQYLEIPFATIVGYLIFSELPDTLASVGIAITIGAGLYIVMRERAMSRVAPAVP
ncbi:DMT family transporter [Planktotalea arctica]|uniref:DMT family transporter n=1 Tax=Planktotalea arctica TaxID=1481893 RepID=UPI000A1730BA|nr:DMT family transporter [Planktotalea arctica]